MKQIIKNLKDLRTGIFKDEQAVNKLIDETIKLAEIKASQLDALVKRLAEKKEWLERQKEVAKNIKADLAMACWTGTIIITEQIIKEVETIGKSA